jgi:polyhydroxyalkanoate synthesis regulator phasin
MDAPGSTLRDAIERIALVGLGAASLTADRAEELAEALEDRGLARREDVREVLDELRERWRGETARLGERAGDGVQALLAGLGIMGGGAAAGAVGGGRERIDEIELRLAQIEHRLRLVEAGQGDSDPPA